MDLIDTLLSAGDGATMKRMAERAGVGREDAHSILSAVVPELARGVERNTLSRGGLADLVNALGSGHHEGYLDDPDRAGSDTGRRDGNAILGHVVGSKHASRMIAARAERETGVNAATVERMLPEIAAVAMGGLSRQAFGPLDEILTNLPGGSANAGRGGMPEQRPLPIPGEPVDQGGLSRDWTDRAPEGGDIFSNQNIEQHGGDVQGGGFGNQSPLPVPGGAPGGEWGTAGPRDTRRGGYRDLSDILRRRGGRVPGQGGGSLWSLVRQIIGSALGFRNGGVMSWIIRLILFRVLWPILKRMVLGR